MATIVKKLPKRRGGTGREEVYPWGEWLDGRVRKLTPGEDFVTNVTGFRNVCHKAARRHGVKVATRMEDGSFYLQAYSD